MENKKKWNKPEITGLDIDQTEGKSIATFENTHIGS